jgi:hypothetical protein
MSLSRVGEDAEWFGKMGPGYYYIAQSHGRHTFNAAIRDPETFCELAMRALDQSRELDDKQLEACEHALRERFDYCFENDE